MTDPTPNLAELRRLAEAATPGPWAARYGVSWEARVCTTTGSLADVDSTANAELIAAAINALPALLDAAAERDALTVAQPCVMRMGEVYDFAWCETHDRTFALGSSCDHAGLSHVDYLDEDGRRQRGRAVLAEMEMERIAAERDALAAKVERVRALPAKHPAGGWYMTSMRDVLAALDEEPQP